MQNVMAFCNSIPLLLPAYISILYLCASSLSHGCHFFLGCKYYFCFQSCIHSHAICGHPIIFPCQLVKLADVLRLRWLRFPLGMLGWLLTRVDESTLPGFVICVSLHIDNVSGKPYDYCPAGVSLSAFTPVWYTTAY